MINRTRGHGRSHAEVGWRAPEVRPQRQIDLHDLRAVRWKPALAQRDVLSTKTPDLGLMTLPGAVRSLAERGIHTATLDITPSRKVAKSIAGASDAYDSWHDVPPAEVARWKRQQINQIVDFVAAAKKVDPNFHFLLHSRVNDQGQYTRDMVTAIQALEDAHLGSRISGVMIGEHELRRPGQSLRLALDVTQRINRQDFDHDGTADKWLAQSHRALTLHGNGFGSDFGGIADAVKRTDFLRKISAETGQFGFSFKFFRPHDLDVPGRDTKRAWEKFVEKDLGLGELARTMDKYRDAYPDHTSVIFMGDSADGVNAIRSRKDGAGDAIMGALQATFRRNGWHGFAFGGPIDSRDLMADGQQRGMLSPFGTPQRAADDFQRWDAHTG